MRIKIRFFGNQLLFDYGFKEPDFISAEEVRLYTNEDQLSPKLRKIDKMFRKVSKRHGIKEVFVKDLSPMEIDLLTRKGYTCTLRTRMIKGKSVIKNNHYRVYA